MGQVVNIESIGTAVAIAIIFAFVKLFRDVDQIKTAQRYEIDALKKEVDPVVTWYVKTSMDALKIATNPTSERLTELADRYIASIKGDQTRRPLNTQEKQELIDGLRDVMNDKKQFEAKRQSASMSLRFIETREGLNRQAKAQTEH